MFEFKKTVKFLEKIYDFFNELKNIYKDKINLNFRILVCWLSSKSNLIVSKYTQFYSFYSNNSRNESQRWKISNI